jgi:glycosyltransferase involved in cell wall biosynthesis
MARLLAEAGSTLTLCLPAPPENGVGAYLESAGVRVIVRAEIFIPGIAGIRAAGQLFRSCRPNIVHFNMMPGLHPLMWLAKLAGVKKVFSTDQTSRPEGFVPKAAWLPKRLLARGLLAPLDGHISISDYVLECNRTLGYCRPDVYSRIYNGTPGTGPPTEQRRNAFRARFRIPADKILVTQVSWLIPEKGIFDLVRTARTVADRNSDIHFLIVGEGAARPELERLREDLGLQDRVTFSGLVVDPIEEGVYAATDISCHFARWQEAFGWVIAEAMSQGKPIVGSRAGAIGEMVEEGVSGFLVQVGDSEALANRILRLAASPELRRQLGEEAQKRAGRLFDLAANAELLFMLYGFKAASNG